MAVIQNNENENENEKKFFIFCITQNVDNFFFFFLKGMKCFLYLIMANVFS